MKVVDDLRTELRATSRAAQNQQRHFERLAEQNAQARNEAESLLQQRDRLEMSFRQMYQLQESTSHNDQAKVQGLEMIMADQHAKAQTAFEK